MIVAGIDEAGKGPVLGPLVICLFEVDEAKLPELKKIGVADSKLLTPARREEIFEQLKKIGKWQLEIVQPAELDSREASLNKFELAKVAGLIEKSRAERIWFDSIEADGKKVAAKLNKLLRKPREIVAEPKADRTYPVVSAASIVAKVTRDGEIEKLKEKWGEIGSGYPSDPETVEWLDNWFKENKFPPAIARKTWETIERRMAVKRQKGLEEFDA